MIQIAVYPSLFWLFAGIADMLIRLKIILQLERVFLLPDKVYLITHSQDDKSAQYIEKISKVHPQGEISEGREKNYKYRDLFECLQSYKQIIKEEEHGAHIYINVSTGSKVSSIAGTLACMIWKGTPYYAHIDYDNKKDPADGLPDENVT